MKNLPAYLGNVHWACLTCQVRCWCQQVLGNCLEIIVLMGPPSMLLPSCLGRDSSVTHEPQQPVAESTLTSACDGQKAVPWLFFHISPFVYSCFFLF